jgi:hypothetical protein
VTPTFTNLMDDAAVVPLISEDAPRLSALVSRDAEQAVHELQSSHEELPVHELRAVHEAPAAREP